jgi:hypothetical protein
MGRGRLGEFSLVGIVDVDFCTDSFPGWASLCRSTLVSFERLRRRVTRWKVRVNGIESGASNRREIVERVVLLNSRVISGMSF